MICAQKLSEVYKRVYSGEESAVQPSPTLRDELRHGVYQIC